MSDSLHVNDVVKDTGCRTIARIVEVCEDLTDSPWTLRERVGSLRMARFDRKSAFELFLTRRPLRGGMSSVFARGNTRAVSKTLRFLRSCTTNGPELPVAPNRRASGSMSFA